MIIIIKLISINIISKGERIKFGEEILECRSTPGHTNGCISLVSHSAKIVFTGDALLIRGCGRTDFQQGNSSTLYDSIHNKILSLPQEYSVFPAHDYQGKLLNNRAGIYLKSFKIGSFFKGLTSSSIGEEKKYNPRLKQNKEDFINTMKNLNLAYPRYIDIALPANLVCGIFEQKK